MPCRFEVSGVNVLLTTLTIFFGAHVSCTAVLAEFPPSGITFDRLGMSMLI